MNDPLVDTLTDALDIYGRPDDGLPVHLAAVLRREHTIDPPFPFDQAPYAAHPGLGQAINYRTELPR